MAAQPSSAVLDKNYDLIAVLQQSLQNAWTLDQYAEDAEAHGDEELARWFRRVQEKNLKAGEQGKQILSQRLRSDENA